MTINVVYRVQCSGPCRRWLSIPDGYEPGEDLPLAALEPRPTAARAGMWPDETAARRAAFAAGWSGGTCPDCRAGVTVSEARQDPTQDGTAEPDPVPCDGCGHPEHPAHECPTTQYGERCACDEPVPAHVARAGQPETDSESR